MVGGGLSIDLFGRMAVRNDGGEVAIRGTRRRALLARLAITPGRVVSSGQLELDVWGDDTPPAPTTLPTQIFRLRRDLAPQTAALLQRDDGYALEIPAGAVDTVRFETLVTSGFPALSRSGDWSNLSGRTASTHQFLRSKNRKHSSLIR